MILDDAETIEEVAEIRQKWVDSNKENNFEEGIKGLLTQLYPDNAHFIYELLQNAEDAEAVVVKFTLTNSEIIFEHDGKKLFNFDNLKSITSIGKSTKANDPTSIGKFGVGFKAVFGYTNTPEIYSKEYNFQIRDLIVPEKIYPKDNFDNTKTRFVFPFNSPDKKPSKAVEEIENELCSLCKNDNTLLFLRHINKISFELPNNTSGCLSRSIAEDIENHIVISISNPQNESISSHWLRFDKEVDILDEEEKEEEKRNKKCTISVAYKLESDAKSSSKWKIIPCEPGIVSIYFPAVKETSNLFFHINAPFASTVERDSVRSCETNNKIRNGIKYLITETLHIIRQNNMLTMEFLKVLPNQNDTLSDFYKPIREAIIEEFKTEQLVPTKSHEFGKGTDLYRAPATLSNIITDDELSVITKRKKPLWAANASQRSQRDDNFLSSLGINEWSWDKLLEFFNNFTGEKQDILNKIFFNKDDKWLMSFYELLYKACDETKEKYRNYVYIYKYHYFANIPIVRVESNDEKHFVKPNEAYFVASELRATGDVHFVKRSVYLSDKDENSDARKFLEKIGVKPYDEKAVIELRLEYYNGTLKEIPKEYFDDIRNFVRYSKKDGNSINIFQNVKFLVGSNPSDRNKCSWRNPVSLCIDTPYADTGLSELSEIHEKYLLWDKYSENLSQDELKDLTQFVKSLGVMYELKVEKLSNSWSNWDDLINNAYRKWAQQYGWAGRTDYETYNDYSIKNIENYIKNGSVAASLLLWKAIISASSYVKNSDYQPNARQLTYRGDSHLITTMREQAWIPAKSGDFRKPEDMIREELRTEFVYDDKNGLMTAIRFGEKARQQTATYKELEDNAKKIGFKSHEEAQKAAKLAKVLDQSGKSIDDIINQYTPKPVADNASSNPEQRNRRVQEIAKEESDRVKTVKERTVTYTGDEDERSRAYLLYNYRDSDPDKIMRCQICGKTLGGTNESPFQTTDGEWHFQKEPFLPSLRKKTHRENFLALCHNHAAMFRFIDDQELQKIEDFILKRKKGNERYIQVNILGAERKIWFTTDHINDLKSLLEQNRAEGGSQ